MNRIKLKNVKSWRKLSKKKKIITSTIAVVLVCSVTGSLIFIKIGNAGQSAKMTAQSTTVTKGNISNTIVGTGTLEEDASGSITVPSGITVKSISVESGDKVSKGDTLATVDKTSVLEAIETVQEQIEELDEKINDCKDSEEKTTVNAKVSGTVKKIYAKKGDDVTDCISENGALLVIAIDGDKTQNIDVTASGGTVSKVYVSKGDKVEAGDKLIVIENDTHSVEYKKYMAQRKALASSLKNLLSISKTGTIVADSDGTIGDVNISEGSTSLGSSSSSNSNSSESSNSSTATASKMSYVTGSNKLKSTASAGVSNKTANIVTASAVTLSTVSKSGSAGNSTTESTTATTSVESSTNISFEIASSGKTTSNKLVVATPKTGNAPQTKIENTDSSYTGTIKWNAESNTFDSETTYSAEIVLTAKEGFVFGADSITKIEKGLVSGITLSDDYKILSFKITFPETEAVNKSETSETTNESKKTTSNNSEISTKSSVKNSNANSGNTSNTDSINSSRNNNSNATNMDSTYSNSGNLNSGTANTSTATIKSSSTDSNSSSEADTDYDSYSNEVTAFTMSTDETMLMSVSVDELDINSVEKNQEAQITLDAIENKTFTGKVTKVGNSATSSSSGVSKYTVKISIPKDEQMKIGMNASATIVIESKEDILTVPINALQEKGNKTYVYTEKDSDGNLSGETEITTGLSDGDNVEVTEGLSEGDTIYYNKTGNTSSGGNMSGDSNKGPRGMQDSNGGSDMKSGGRGGDFSGGYGGNGGTPGQKPNQ